MNHSDTDHPQPSAPATPPGWEDGEKTPRPTNQHTMTRDFHFDTHFNPMWTCSKNVFSFPDGTVVPPETYAPEPYPGHLDRGRSIRGPMATYAARVSKDPKWWKNVAITEHDDAEFEVIQARKAARFEAVEVQEEHMYQNYYEHWEGSCSEGSQDK